MQGFGGEPEGKTPLGRPWHNWEDNIMMVLQEVVLVGMDWIDLAQGRAIKFGEFLDQLRTGSLVKKDSAVWSK